MVIVFTPACTTVQPTTRQIALAGWIGHSFEEAYSDLGAPEYVFSDGVEGRVLVYTSVEGLPSGLPISDAVKSHAKNSVWDPEIERTTPTLVAQRFDLLYVNKDGIIYSLQSNESDRHVRQLYETNEFWGGVIGVSILTFLLLTTSGS